ncbi:DNA polymerase/3'-5' exonuclease PolX [Patescibacteria group bacterium]|nr:DNA polymerase/3'-5' exonuclease PolX [Patescibacteria group bacterium]
MKIGNQEIARILEDIADYLEMQGVAWKPAAYRRAAGGIAGLNQEVAAVYGAGGLKALMGVPGVGEAIALKIEELVKTGRLKYYDKLRKAVPVDLAGLSRVEGLGPKRIYFLYKKLKVKNLKDLERAVRSGKVQGLKGFGEKSGERIAKGLDFAKGSGKRFILGHVMPELEEIERRLRSVKGVKKATLAGSSRRMKETIGDADFLVVASDPEKVMDAFTKMPDVSRVLAKGDTKSMVRLASGLQVDVRVVPDGSYGSALNYFTGSKEHNVALRTMAEKRGWKLNEYGLWRGDKFLAGRTEEELYKAFGMEYVPPEMRENRGEIDLALAGKLPDIIGYGDLKGDLQTQSEWTDGEASIAEMAGAAIRAGLEYMAVTDHTKRLAMTHGLDEKRLAKQGKEIDELNAKYRKQHAKFRILKGTECDILKDGSLDLPDRALAGLDVVGVSVHSHFDLPRREQTERIIKAMKNPNVDILFHPTGRLIGKRPAYDVDMRAVIAEAKRTGTVLEIDALPERADLSDEYVRECVRAGVKMSIDSDAHAAGHFGFLKYGIAQARRGWATRADIINTYPLAKLLKFLGR